MLSQYGLEEVGRPMKTLMKPDPYYPYFISNSLFYHYSNTLIKLEQFSPCFLSTLTKMYMHAVHMYVMSYSDCSTKMYMLAVHMSCHIVIFLQRCTCMQYICHVI
jgi:hypothetical protein